MAPLSWTAFPRHLLACFFLLNTKQTFCVFWWNFQVRTPLFAVQVSWHVGRGTSLKYHNSHIYAVCQFSRIVLLYKESCSRKLPLVVVFTRFMILLPAYVFVIAFYSSSQAIRMKAHIYWILFERVGKKPPCFGLVLKEEENNARLGTSGFFNPLQ